MAETKHCNLVLMALAIFLGLVAISGALYFAPQKNYAGFASAPMNERNLLYVNSQASEEITPDKVEIILSVVSRGTDPTQLQMENDAKIRAIQSSLISAGVLESNIKTIGYSLDKWSEWNKTSEQVEDRGYTITNTLRVVSYDTSIAGKIIKSSVTSGANDVQNIQFLLSDKLRDEVYARLLKEACAGAKQKAQSMASASGVGIRALASLNEGYSYVEPISNSAYYAKDSAVGASGAEVSISAGKAKVSASVSASYEVG